MVYFFLSITILFIVLHIIFSKKVRKKSKIIEISLFYFLVVCIGCMSLFSGICHIFFSDWTAHLIGWPAGSPFQFEVGMAGISYGILGILCIWLRGYFWFATIISSGIFLFGDGIGHIIQTIIKGNLAEYNAGAILYFDLIIPVLLLVLYFLNKKNQTSQNSTLISKAQLN